MAPTPHLCFLPPVFPPSLTPTHSKFGPGRPQLFRQGVTHLEIAPDLIPFQLKLSPSEGTARPRTQMHPPTPSCCLIPSFHPPQRKKSVSAFVYPRAVSFCLYSRSLWADPVPALHSFIPGLCVLPLSAFICSRPVLFPLSKFI